ncbi:peptidoglycan D,D-transpeptidase FtsI family protein [Pseudoclavibacter helvolus]|uniref:peptidoglycan D,D-transpeptidase FtsI family protein n=1 Tax=Pseudoclavibacter helvolus TaxID=255205 RepID=UPI0008396998|nr:penicillin-binding transpeptidase domain-containing protein [Pseudoclavibacter helvolus]
MSKNIRLVGVLVIIMFMSLFVASTSIQVFQAETLRDDPRNNRTREESFEIQRGPILVNGTPIASSTPIDTAYKYQRIYENGPLYAAVTGYYSIDGASTGLEGALNPELSGNSDTQFFQGLERLFTGQDPAGAAVETTIDPLAQQTAADALGEFKGAVVATNPATGAILAMYSTPTYDPAALAGHDTETVEEAYRNLLADPNDPLQNRAIGGNMNPPGSVFKLVVAAAALEDGLATAESPLPNPATLTLPGTNVSVNNPSAGAKCGNGDTTNLRIALEQSCNVPFAQLAMDLGAERLREMAEAFGFNHEFEIPMTASASTYPTALEDDAQLALTGFGQFDVRATPLQFAMISAAIANGGEVMNPSLVESIQTPTFQEIQGPEISSFGRAISEETAASLQSMMEGSVNSGVASNARIDGINVAGKTGTAENGEGEPYSLWFTGFAESGDTQIAVAVVLEDGGGMGQSGTGNGLAATIGQQVMKAVLSR